MKLSLALLIAIIGVACGAAPASSRLPDGGRVSDAEPAIDHAPDQPVAPGDADAAGADAVAEIAEIAATDAQIGRPDTPAASADAPDALANGIDATDSSGTGPLPGPQPPGYPSGSAPRIEQKSFTGPLTHQVIGFNVYLPPGYDSGTVRYPTVYDLHGLTGNQFENSQWVIPSLEASMRAKLIGPVIVVFPDGLTESYYADSADGKKPSETRIVRELVPHIDATYRTVADRQLRAVTGFSMGGYGAMELSTKFPEVFRAGVAYDAALDTWQTLVGRRAAIAQSTFGNSETYFDKYSPWANATANAAALRASSALRLCPGTTYRDFDAAFRDHLASLAVPLDYVETTCPHDYGCALGAQGAPSWTFLQTAFSGR
jgi:S-formylglutathione hydrolase FrmB